VDSLAADPRSILGLYLTVIKNSCLVELNSASMNRFGKGDLVGVKVFPARASDDLLRVVS
jgi:hypothetical protein